MRALHVAALLGFACAASADVVTDMTSERIKEAIAEGQRTQPKIYLVEKGDAYCILSTPFSRVRQLAHQAKKEYRDFTDADVTPEIIAAEARFYCPSIKTDSNGLRRGNVTAIVITEKDGKGAPIRPTAMEKEAEKFANAFGATAEGTAVSATFPLDVLKSGRELHVVYDAKVGAPKAGRGISFKHGCDDCAMEIKLDKVR